MEPHQADAALSFLTQLSDSTLDRGALMSRPPVLRRPVATAAVATLAIISAHASIAAQSETRADSSAPSAVRFSLGTIQTMAGYVQFSFADLDSRFAAAHLPKVASGAGSIGLGADVRAGRALFGGGFQSLLTRSQTDAAFRTRMSGSYSLFDVGYALVAAQRLAIYPLVGVGATRVSVNVRERGDFSFDDGLHSPARELGMSGTAALVHAGILIEQRFKRPNGAEFALSIRAGLTRSVGTQAWQSDESRVNGGPSGVRGSYLRIGFSRPLANRRDAVLPIAGTVLQTVLR